MNKLTPERRAERKIERAEYVRLWQINKRAKSALPDVNKIQCQICGLYYRQVGSHIVQVHKITAREYRREYGFDVKRGQLPEDYRKLKADQVFENGTVDNLQSGKVFWFTKGSKTAGRYERSLQTMERLKKGTKCQSAKFVENKEK